MRMRAEEESFVEVNGTCKRIIDWELVGIEYRAGLKTVRQIALDHGISHTAIQKRAKTACWTRDLSQKIQQKAKSLVATQEVATSVAKQTKLKEEAAVSLLAQKVADIDLFNKADIRLGSDINRGLLEDLAALSRPGLADRLVQLGELMDESGPNANGTWIKDKLNEEYRYIISIAGRIKMAKDLGAAVGMYVPLQRKIAGLDAEKQGNQIDELLLKIHAERTKRESLV